MIGIPTPPAPMTPTSSLWRIGFHAVFHGLVGAAAIIHFITIAGWIVTAA